MNDSSDLRTTPVAGLSPEILLSVQSGHPNSLVHALALLARGWFIAAGLRMEWRAKIGATFLVAGTAQCAKPLSSEHRALLAAACDLHDVLAHSPDGREALLNLALQPVAEHTESE